VTSLLRSGPGRSRNAHSTTSIALIWIASRVFVFAAAIIGGWRTLQPGLSPASIAKQWFQWDTIWFDSIAKYGYVGPRVVELHKDFHYNVAFFPGLPALMRAGALMSLDRTWAGLLVSVIAGFAAAMALDRLAALAGISGRWTVIAWVAAPTAVFLTAAYTEGLFCAAAFWAWWFARRQQWAWAGLLAGAAALVRINGLFLGIGLLAMLVTTRPVRWRNLGWVALPFVATLGYLTYLRAITGSWTAWNDAQRIYWHRHLTDPVHALLKTWHHMFIAATPGNTATEPSRFAFEIAAMAIIVIVAVWLIRSRAWAELAYIAVTAVSLATSSVYLSVPRTLVVLFPVWLALGTLLTRYRWLRWVYLIVALPALAYWTYRFTHGWWVS